MTVRVRFAPSPTGYLHVGGARTAIFNYLFARKHGGVFVLRIEDTDTERSTEEAIRTILEGMEWMGIAWDEGPFYQSEFLKAHAAAAHRLLGGGSAYRCFATPEELKVQRETLQKEGKTWRYDPFSRELDPAESDRLASEGRPFVIRFKVPREGRTLSFIDGVFGEIARVDSEIEDFALLRTDGSPLYNLSVVEDDARMTISHVIRGQDHLNNTFKQILLYEALGYAVPEFSHLPLILAPDKSKLSKRKHGEVVSVTTYRDRGFIPEAFVNFMTLVGWNPGDEREVMSMRELVEAFDLSRVNKSNAIFNFDEQKDEWTDRKAVWMNAQYISQEPLERVAAFAGEVLKKEDLWDPAYEGDRRAWFMDCVDEIRQRFHSLLDFASLGRAYFSDDYDIDAQGYEKRVAKQAEPLKNLLPDFVRLLEELPDFKEEILETAIPAFCEEREIKMGLVMNAVRILVTGQAAGPGIYRVLVLIGRERLVRRIRNGLDAL